MHIYVDADACPRPVKEILFRAATTREVPVTLVANQWLTVPDSPYVKYLPVKPGFDEADFTIVELVEPGDLVVTADIALADEAIKKGATGLDPRGDRYTAENIGGIRATREFLATFRDGGIEFSSGPPPYSERDKRAFANQLDRYLTKRESVSK